LNHDAEAQRQERHPSGIKNVILRGFGKSIFGRFLDPEDLRGIIAAYDRGCTELVERNVVLLQNTCVTAFSPISATPKCHATLRLRAGGVAVRAEQAAALERRERAATTVLAKNRSMCSWCRGRWAGHEIHS
jgi:hypothetical protein